VIGLGGGLVTYGAVRRLIEGSPPIETELGLAAMAVAAMANVVMSLYMRREARLARSMALRAEATHLQTNVVQAGTIITGLVLVEITDEVAFDAITALCLAAYMAWASVGLVRTALEEMLDRALPEGDLRAINDVLRSHAGEVRGFHQLRTRRSGATRHVDMHLLFDAERSVREVHDTADRIEADIKHRLPGSIVVIHTEPDEGQEREEIA
jgi:cation diffusion facilitator family transporter